MAVPPFWFVHWSLLSALHTSVWFQFIYFVLVLLCFSFWRGWWQGVPSLLRSSLINCRMSFMEGESTDIEISSLLYFWRPKWLETWCEKDEGMQQAFQISGLENWNNEEKYGSQERKSFFFLIILKNGSMFQYTLLYYMCDI